MIELCSGGATSGDGKGKGQHGIFELTICLWRHLVAWELGHWALGTGLYRQAPCRTCTFTDVPRAPSLWLQAPGALSWLIDKGSKRMGRGMGRGFREDKKSLMFAPAARSGCLAYGWEG